MIDPDEPTELEVGLYLYASCSAEEYGRVVAIGKDGNGVPSIDIEVLHPNDLIDCNDDEASGSKNPQTWLDVSPGATLILREVHYKHDGNRIVCNTPGNGCYRCTKLFWLRRTTFEQRCEAARREARI